MKTKNKHGFTLIELLAVIVVLAIIALIATPIVMKTIKNAKKGAAERSADSYIKQVEVAVATSKLDGNEVQDGTYTINNDGNLLVPSLKGGELKIEMSGSRPKGGEVTITNGQATLTSPTEINKLTVTYDSTNKKYVASEKGSTPSSTVVYRWSEDDINIGDTINPSDTSKFTKDASTLGKNSYLKHVLDKDNKVTESYVCAIFGGKEYCLTNVEFGWSKNESDYTGNALILKKYQSEDLLECDFSEDEMACRNDDVTLYAGSDNIVRIQESGGECMVNYAGLSGCTSY